MLAAEEIGGNIGPVTRTCGVSRIALQALPNQAFLQQYLWPRKPVILSGATKEWPALASWTPEFFHAQYGSKTIVVRHRNKRYQTKLSEFIHYTRRCGELHHDGSDLEPLYLRNITVANVFPELLPDFSVPECFLPNWLERWPLRSVFPVAPQSSAELFIGSPGARGPTIHRDRYMTHSWLAQIYGRKRFWMVSPQQEELIYQSECDADVSRVNSIKTPDLTKFPRFAMATVLTGVLQPGEIIFIPAGWWHTAECLTVGISLSGNFVNASNFQDFCRQLDTFPMFQRHIYTGRLLSQSFLRLQGALCRIHDRLHARGTLNPRSANMAVLPLENDRSF